MGILINVVFLILGLWGILIWAVCVPCLIYACVKQARRHHG